MTDASKPTTDALVADLAADGTLDSRGQFTVDPARARELLASFRLADPATWAAELIQCATLLHASRLEATVTRERVDVAFDGDPFTREELELADSALLARVETPRQRAVAQLAAALAGASAVAAREVRVTSGGLTLVRRPGEPDRLAPAEPAGAGTRVTVDRRTRGDDDLPEASALATLGRHADLPIHVNGGKDSWGMAFPGAALSAPLAGEGFTGVAQITVSAGSPGLVIRQHGLQVARERLANELDFLLVVIDAPGAERDLGLGQVREGALLDAIREAARTAADDLLGAAVGDLDRRQESDAKETLRQALRSAYLGSHLPAGIDAAKLPLWPVLSGQAGERHRSLEALVGGAGPKPHLRFTTLPVEALELEVLGDLGPRDRIFLARDEREAQALARRGGVPAAKLDDHLRSRRPGRWELARKVLVPMGWWCLLLPFALASVHLGRGCYHERLAQRSWPTVQAELTRAHVEESRDDDGWSYVVRVELRYQVKGKTYHRKLYIDSFRFEARAHRKLLEVKEQARWPLRINPRNPNHVLEKPERLWVPVVLFGWLPVLLIVGLFSAVIGGLRSAALVRELSGGWQLKRLRDHLAALDAGRKT
jgi:hypothetical protein